MILKALVRVPMSTALICMFVCSVALARKGETAFVFINGGYDETSNYSIHEADLKTFKDNLFNGSRIALFSAGGAKSPVIEMDRAGYFLRDSKGFALSAPSNIEGTEKATKANIANHFASLAAKNPPAAVTAVWGDHGGSNGVALWDDSRLNATDIRAIYRKLPSTTLVRALHLHCYSGIAMSGPESEIPLVNPEQSQTFLNDKYPANNCGLSLSDSDEIGQYRHDQSKWKTDLATKPITLTKLKAALEKDPDLYPSLMLTSDYLLRDLKVSICSKDNKSAESGKAQAKTEATVCLSCGNISILDSSVSKLKSGLCEISKTGTEILEDFENRNAVYEEFSNLQAQVSRGYIEKKYPDFYAQFKAAMVQVNSIKTKISKETNKAKLDALVLELETVRSNFPARYSRYVDMTEHADEFVSFFNKTVTPSWLAARKDKFPLINKTVRNPKNKDYFAGTSMMAYQREITDKRDSLSKERAKLISKLNSDRKALTKVLFADPKLKHLKERYENILKCEDSSLD